MFFKKNYLTKENSGQQDYRIYRFSKWELVKYSSVGFLTGSLFLYFFYQSKFVFPAGILGTVIFCRWKKKELCKYRKQNLQKQFKDWLQAAVNNLQAGNSMENSFLKAGKEMQLLYGKESDICKEADLLEHRLCNNMTLEYILTDFGERSGIEDIQNFADIFMTGKRSGGNLKEMIEECVEVIVMKEAVEREIRIMIYGKITEQKIMCLVPFGIVLYINLTSPGYFNPLYHNMAGICIMTFCMFVYLFSVKFSSKIINIEV